MELGEKELEEGSSGEALVPMTWRSSASDLLNCLLEFCVRERRYSSLGITVYSSSSSSSSMLWTTSMLRRCAEARTAAEV